MKALARYFLLTGLIYLIAAPAWAQVSKVTADAEGITWPSCAAVMEIALRRLDGVDKISISISRQRFEVTFKPGAIFQPAKIRAAVAQADVKVVRFQISALGRAREQGRQRYFVAGKDQFLLIGPGNIPFETAISVEGTVDDSVLPLQLKILRFKALKPWAWSAFIYAPCCLAAAKENAL